MKICSVEQTMLWSTKLTVELKSIDKVHDHQLPSAIFFNLQRGWLLEDDILNRQRAAVFHRSNEKNRFCALTPAGHPPPVLPRVYLRLWRFDAAGHPTPLRAAPSWIASGGRTATTTTTTTTSAAVTTPESTTSTAAAAATTTSSL